jgi:hypothetical protein
MMMIDDGSSGLHHQPPVPVSDDHTDIFGSYKLWRTSNSSVTAPDSKRVFPREFPTRDEISLPGSREPREAFETVVAPLASLRLAVGSGGFRFAHPA